MTIFASHFDNYYYDGVNISWNVSLNHSDVPFSSQVEGIVRVNIGTGISWQCQYVHLYRGDTYLRSVSAGPTGWMSYPDRSFSTQWYSHCGRNGNYRAVASIRFDKPNRITGPYRKLSSQWHWFGGC